jgi:hypothetical protein
MDEKARQLEGLDNQSGLIPGFSKLAFVEFNLTQDTSEVLLTLFGAAAALVVVLMLISTLNATYMLVAILRYDCVTMEVPFDQFCMKRCELDWNMVLRMF